ncbi:unnamed protein product [Dovyalis caffra]|uniref:Uncharacterized protein n=1 Tax=Dovyalis caffra TaxID=77055 RepID=A0AAV1SA83_9ROSI|nr:unnamed protein product [Dovyalis caffra]
MEASGEGERGSLEHGGSSGGRNGGQRGDRASRRGASSERGDASNKDGIAGKAAGGERVEILEVKSADEYVRIEVQCPGIPTIFFNDRVLTEPPCKPNTKKHLTSEPS